MSEITEIKQKFPHSIKRGTGEAYLLIKSFPDTAIAYARIFKQNKTKECKEPLEILYDKMNCGIHRNEIIEILIENEVLSDKIKNEIKYDSYLETRELIQ